MARRFDAQMLFRFHTHHLRLLRNCYGHAPRLLATQSKPQLYPLIVELAVVPLWTDAQFPLFHDLHFLYFERPVVLIWLRNRRDRDRLRHPDGARSSNFRNCCKWPDRVAKVDRNLVLPQAT